MEYLLGSLVTLLTILIINRTVNRATGRELKSTGIAYTQSFVHSTLYPFITIPKDLIMNNSIKTQARKHLQKNSFRVLFVEDKAYWIKDNIFYTAEVSDGSVNEETTSRVDIMGMDEVQLKEMSFIVDKLTEGIDDENRYSGQ
jgi:hypothetical protein